MAITSAIVLYAVTWFMTMFIVLPIRMVTQGDAGEVVPGTPAGAPNDVQMRRKIRLTTWIATPVWAVISAIILSGWIEVRDFDWMNQLPPEAEADGTGG